jgi:hypothetical protein
MGSLIARENLSLIRCPRGKYQVHEILKSDYKYARNRG